MRWFVQVKEGFKWRMVRRVGPLTREEAAELQERLERYLPEREFRSVGGTSKHGERS